MNISHTRYRARSRTVHQRRRMSRISGTFKAVAESGGAGKIETNNTIAHQYSKEMSEIAPGPPWKFWYQ